MSVLRIGTAAILAFGIPILICALPLIGMPGIMHDAGFSADVAERALGTFLILTCAALSICFIDADQSASFRETCIATSKRVSIILMGFCALSVQLLGVAMVLASGDLNIFRYSALSVALAGAAVLLVYPQILKSVLPKT